MKLFRMHNGGYTLRAEGPTNGGWTEVTLGYKFEPVAKFSVPQGYLAQVYPEDKPEDQVTLTFRESNVLRMIKPLFFIPGSMGPGIAQQLVLREFFLSRAPDRLLDQYQIDYVEGGARLDYIEWRRKDDARSDPREAGWFSKGLDEEEGVPQHIADLLVRQALIAAGDL